MIMAAGLGKRMRPLTATRPKPLIEVGGKALLDHVLEKLRAAGVRKVVVNVHYLADALEAHLASRAHGLEVVDLRRARPAARNRRRAGPGRAADRLRPVPRRSTATICGSTGRPTRCKLLASHWDDAKMDALLLLVPLARALNHNGHRRLPHGPHRPAPPARPKPCRAVRLHRHPDAVEAAASRRAGRAVLDQHPVGPGDRGRPLLRRGPPGAVVRCRDAASRSS